MATAAINVKPSVTALKTPLKGAFWGVLAFFVVYCARPEDWIPGVRYLHPAKLAGAIALVAFVMSIGRVKRGLAPETFLVILLVGQMGLASLFSPVWKGGAFKVTEGLAQLVLILAVMPLAVNSVERLKKLIFVQTASVAAVAAISIAKMRLVNGRMEGVLNGLYRNPNDLAVAIVLTLPFALFFLADAKSTFRKVIWGAAGLIMTYAVLRTGSRAGLLALAIAGILSFWSLAIKGRRHYLLALGTAAFVIMLALAGQDVIQRFEAIYNPQKNETAYASAQQRSQMLRKSFEVTAEHPLFGVGPGNFQIVSGAWVQTHDIYTELSAECGIPALILFLILYWKSLKSLQEVRRRSPRNSEIAILADASQAGLIAFFLAGFFYPDAYQYFLYFLFGYACVMRLIASTEADASGELKGTSGRESAQQALDKNEGRSAATLMPLPVNLRKW